MEWMFRTSRIPANERSAESFREESPEKITAKDIALEISARYGVTLKDMLGPCRKSRIAWARQEAMAEIRERMAWSFPRIGALFRRNHSTVIWGIQAHNARKERFNAR